MTQRNYCFDIEPQWGSHTSVLSSALESLDYSGHQPLIIEHGAGMYSSPVIAQHAVRVVCIEEAMGWRSWSRWLYEQAGREVSLMSRAKESLPLLASAALVFIDGAARERGDLLKWALAAKVPTIIAHDTEEDTSGTYGYHKHVFGAGEYAVTHDGGKPRTTVWRLHAGPV